MKLHVLFHHPDDDPTWMPNALVIIDEYTLESAGLDYWEEEKERASRTVGPGTLRECIVNVSDQSVQGLFHMPTMRGEVLNERLSGTWYAVENDLIGGWSVATRDAPSSDLLAGEELMDCGSQEVARYIVHLHNSR